jgi:hypothetical protein
MPRFPRTGDRPASMIDPSPIAAGSFDLEHDDVERLRFLSPQTLAALWRQLRRKRPPPGLGGDLLLRALAYTIEERRYGSVPHAAQRALAIALKAEARERRASDGNDKGRVGQRSPDQNRSGSPPSALPRRIAPGACLVREWQGRLCAVTVTADGYAWDGKVYASLSAVAQAITGTRWNGWRFFGVDRTANPSAIRSAADAGADAMAQNRGGRAPRRHASRPMKDKRGDRGEAVNA